MNELSLFSTNQLTPMHFESNNMLLSTLAEYKHYPVLELRIEENERVNLPKFTGFTEHEMIYFFVHERKHIRTNRERKGDTKKEYLRNLLQFYKYVVESKDFLKDDVEDYIEGSLLKNLRPRHIRNYHQYISTAPLGKGKKPYSPATLDAKTTVTKSFLRWLFDKKYIEYPLHEELLSTSLAEEDIPDRDLHYHEVKQLLDFYQNNPINHALLTMLAMTGLRIREIAAAKWGDLYYDVSSGQYRLKGKGKGDKPFDKLISEVLFERIVKYRERRKVSTELTLQGSQPLFPTKDGNFYNYKNLSNYIIRIIEKADLPFLKQRDIKVTPHFFRHFFAIYSRQQGADIFTIQKSLGHSDRRTTERYLEKQLRKENEVGLLWDSSKF
ncbi:MAG TPA: site-specific integrase [Bacillus sp. (in: firmicutes)]|nr:site-specific integrase [Bacillus sp. (in: firmicutes)]